MPKDATKNIDRYKIRGGQLNEFDFHQNQEDLAEKQQTQASNLIPGTPPEEKAERLKRIIRQTQKPAKKRATKATKGTKATKSTKKSTTATKARKTTKARKAAPVKGVSAKKLAARKAAKK